MVCRNNNHYPRSREHFLTPSAHRHTHLFGGSGLKKDQVLDLVEEGLKARAISEELGIDVETVQRWRDDPNSRP